MGLYIVIWGKSKDHHLQSESESTNIDKLAPVDEEMTIKTAKNQESLTMDCRRKDESV